MPVYDYRCKDCGGLYDIYHKVREVTSDIICPSCGSAQATKLMSVPGVAVTSAGRSASKAESCGMGDDCCGGACLN